MSNFLYKSIFTTLLVFCIPIFHTEAFVPILVEDIPADYIHIIEDPEILQTYYGEMHGFPHTYEIHAGEPFQLFTQIRLPDIESSRNNVSSIIIKEPEEKGRVIEIVRLEAKTSAWSKLYESSFGDTYLIGPSFEKELEKGVYRIEVHTPDNLEKYVLVIGIKDGEGLGYFELIKRIIGIKIFFDKSAFRIIESPYVYIPLLFLMVIMGSVWYAKRQSRYKNSSLDT